MFFFQAEDGIRDLVRSRGLGDVYKRQVELPSGNVITTDVSSNGAVILTSAGKNCNAVAKLGEVATMYSCLLYTSDAADERSSVDLGGRRIIKKKKKLELSHARYSTKQLTQSILKSINEIGQLMKRMNKDKGKKGQRNE